LLPTSKGALINVRKGRLTVTDGPFSEAKEVVGGYAVLQCKSMEEAIERGRRFMQLHADVLGPSYEGELGIRRVRDVPPFQGRFQSGELAPAPVASLSGWIGVLKSGSDGRDVDSTNLLEICLVALHTSWRSIRRGRNPGFRGCGCWFRST